MLTLRIGCSSLAGMNGEIFQFLRLFSLGISTFYANTIKKRLRVQRNVHNLKHVAYSPTNGEPLN